MLHYKTMERQLLRRTAATITLGTAVLAGCSTRSARPECTPYTIYAQNRWDADRSVPGSVGAAERQAPTLDSPVVHRLGGNALLVASGWYDAGQAAYPANAPGYDGHIWFKIKAANNPSVPDGWVNSAAVRGERTDYDPTGLQGGGLAAPTPSECQLAHP